MLPPVRSKLSMKDYIYASKNLPRIASAKPVPNNVRQFEVSGDDSAETRCLIGVGIEVLVSKADILLQARKPPAISAAVQHGRLFSSLLVRFPLAKRERV